MIVNLVVLNIVRFIGIFLLQIVVINNITVAGMFTPFLFVLFILMLPTNINKLLLLLVSFMMGLLIDITSNMLGFNAFCCTFVAYLRILFANRMLTHDEPIVISSPSIRSVVPQQFIAYVMMLLFIYGILYFSLVYMDFRAFGKIVLSAALCALITTVLSVLLQLIFIPAKKNTI